MTEPLRGRALIEDPLRNKGTAFTEEERVRLGLIGLLPPHVETLAEQVVRAYQAYQTKGTDLGRHIYLRALQDNNETLFYRLVVDHLTEMLPILYTPVVGQACQQFSEIYRRPRGLFLSYPRRDRMEEMLRNYGSDEIRAIVVTDGERILGLGDQGAGGMGIPIGKLSLYVACGGIDPRTTLPVILDVGTNNAERLEDPLYIGWRHERIQGDEYVAFVDAFVDAVARVWPDALLQFEDFAFQHATPLLARYRDRLCMFNDDVQGTAVVALGTLLSAVAANGQQLVDQRVAVLGGGSAGCGIAGQIIAAMVEAGLSEADARGRVFVIDRVGLLDDAMSDLAPFQAQVAHPHARVADWRGRLPEGGLGLLDVIEQGRPTALFGVSGQPGLFTEDVVRAMAQQNEHPMIFPLSNPTHRMEAAPADLFAWTDGRARVATGSPVTPIESQGREIPVAQCNNAYVFPAIGLGVLAVSARRVTDEMLRAAAVALGEASPARSSSDAPLLPPLDDIRRATREVARAVAAKAIEQGQAPGVDVSEIDERIEAVYWEPAYRD